METVAELAAPGAIVVAGDSWRSVDLPVSSYELIFPDRLALVDTGLDLSTARSMSARVFDAAAYARMSRILHKAALVAVTHEHPDHLGGLLAQPDPKLLLAVTRLTREQVSELNANLRAEPFTALGLPTDLFDGYRPLPHARYQAIAPGVVLIQAPGHTPGSQMFYVRRADGVEFLFLGDVAWTMRSVRTLQEKARLATWMAGENRGAVRDELAALGHLHATHPEINMMPGHDARAIARFVANGRLLKGFVAPRTSRPPHRVLSVLSGS